MYWMHRLLSRQSTSPLPTRAVLDDVRVRVFAGDQEIGWFEWTTLESVRAWKQDCFGVDRVWIGFDTTGPHELVCIHEEVDGYTAVVVEMDKRCEGCLRNWWGEVAYPAFAQKHTVLWKREP